ncbi:MAG: hypothetical protein IJ509_01185 [Bacilli bacterium]|nr:hypothetical protein [Bacilli bacterium]
MNNMEDIKSRIDEKFETTNGLESDELIQLFKDAKELENEDHKAKLFDYFIKKLKDAFKEWEVSKEGIEKNITEIREDLKAAGLSETEIDDLFNRNEFTIENILDSEKEQEENEEEIVEQEENEEEIVEQEEKEIEKINKRINELENGKEQKNLEELQESLQKLEEEEARLNNTQYEGYKEHLDKKARLEEIKKEKKQLQEQIKNAELKDKLHNLEEEAKLNSTQYENHKEHLAKKERLEAIQKEKREIIGKLKNKDLTTKQLQERLTKLENKKNELHQKLKDAPRHHTSYSEMSKILVEIEQVNNEINARLQNSKELEKLKGISAAYKKIQDDVQKELKNEKYNDYAEEELKTEVDRLLNEHELISELDKYENADKLKAELKEDIFNNLKSKKIDKKETNKKLLLKGLAAVAGFGTGLALSSVPGVGTIRMGISGVKLVSSAINAWSKKHPDGKIAKIKNSANEKLNNKFPKLIEKVNKMRAKLKSEPLNWFVNGVAAGYITGNIIELVTGETVLEHLTGDSKNVEVTNLAKETGATDNAATSTDNATSMASETDAVIPEINPAEITLNQGEVVDLSSITEGFTSSTSNVPVDVMEQVGKEVMFDRAVTLPDGKVMWHFKQLNGAGYAWLEAEKVQEVLAKAAEVAQTASKSL